MPFPCLNPSGVGRALCQRLLQVEDELHLCLACRNPGRAEAVRAALLATRPSAQVSTVQVDVSDLRSVLRAARELRHRWASRWRAFSRGVVQRSH